MRDTATSAFAAGRYTVEGLISHGGMAAVYLAHDRDLDRRVAVKVLSEPLALDEAFVERFRREAKTAAQLSHPNVVQVYDAGEENGRLFIVMEYIDGEGLDETLHRERKLAPGRVLDLALQACSALDYAHGKGVVHRDVKPANLLLGPNAVLKVADFGIARPAEATQLTEAGTVLGTAAYLAPEVARGGPATVRSDIYSLGVVLYELFTGRPPYRIENLAQLVVHRDQPVPALRELAPAVSEATEAAVMRCIARDPRYRPASAAELAAELGRDARTAGVTEPRARATVPLRRRLEAPPRRIWAGRRALTLLGAILALALAGVALAVAGVGGDAPAQQQTHTVRINPVPSADVPEQQARNLAEWIRAHSAAGG